MEKQLFLRHYHEIMTQATLTPQVPSISHVSFIVRILFFLLPTLFFLIISFILIKPSLRITKRYDIFTLPKQGVLFILGLVYAFATLLISLHAVISDAWTSKEWMLYTFICVFGAFMILLYAKTEQLGTNALIGVAILGLVNAFLNQWFYIQMMDLSYNNQAIKWKTISRVFQGLRTAFALIHSIQIFSQVLVHYSYVKHQHQIVFFWIATLLLYVGLSILNSMPFGPFLDALGFIIGGVIYLIPSLLHTLQYNNVRAKK